MDPDEKRLPPGAPLEPFREGVVHGLGVALRGQVSHRVDGAPGAFVIDVESLCDAEAAIEDEGADEGCGLIALLIEDLGQGLLFFGKAVGAVVANAVDGRVVAGHDRSVRGQRQWNRRSRPREVDPAPGKAVELRRGDLLRAVAAQGVGPQRVDRDQQEICLRFGGGCLGHRGEPNAAKEESSSSRRSTTSPACHFHAI